jgi:alpha-tubulin suppressor-like RCC1 family protein
MFVTSEGELYSWGEGFYGATGLATIENTHHPRLVKFQERISSVSCGYNHSAVVDVKGKVHTCGLNDSG